MIFSSAPNDFLNLKYSDELYHHGIKGQKWGIRRFQNPDGTLTAEGKSRYGLKEQKYEYKYGDNKVYRDYTSKIKTKTGKPVIINRDEETDKSIVNKIQKDIDKINNNCVKAIYNSKALNSEWLSGTKYEKMSQKEFIKAVENKLDYIGLRTYSDGSKRYEACYDSTYKGDDDFYGGHMITVKFDYPSGKIITLYPEG